jgi:antirestriction protein
MEPRVYIGTYAKYNRGSIAGGWLTLTDYKNYGDFCDACRKLHSDEADPELMIQDYESFPDGLSCTEWINKEDFYDVINACNEEDKPNLEIVDYSEKAIALIGDTKAIKEKLKKLGGRFNPRLSCGAGWIFSKSKLEEVQALVSGAEVVSKQTETCDYKKNLEAYCNEVKSDLDFKKDFIGIVNLSVGQYRLSKHSINNRFCFADEGPSYDLYCSLSDDKKKLEKYFIDKNINEASKKLRNIKDNNHIYYATSKNNYGKEFVFFTLDDRRVCTDQTDAKVLPEEDRQAIIKGLEWSIEQFKKRLDTYLKRYGTSKIHMWTYWRDA